MRGARKRRRQEHRRQKQRAQEDPLYKKSCYKKFKHLTRMDAQKHIEALYLSLGEKYLHAYECLYCGNWHVGHYKKETM